MQEPALSLRVLAQPWRWWLARGCPPPFQDDRKWVRVLRVSLLLGLLGTLSAWVSAVWLQMESLLWEPPNSFLWIGSLLYSPGLWFGLIVLLPVSRWRGRNWIASLLAIPVSAGCLIGALFTWAWLGAVIKWQFPLQDWSGRVFEVLGAAALGGIGGAYVQFWMTDWTRPGRRKRAWPTIIAGASALILTMLLGGTTDPIPYTLPDVLREILAMQRMLGPFQTLVAMALGIPFWNPVQSPIKLSSPELLTRVEVTQGERGDVSPFGDGIPVCSQNHRGESPPPARQTLATSTRISRGRDHFR